MLAKTILFSQRRVFKNLICKSRDRLYRMAYAWTHDPHLADDLVQQTICKALANQKQLQDMDAAQGWLFRILSNSLTDYYRAKRDFVTDDQLLDVEARSPERLTQEQQLVDRVRSGIGQLPLIQRQVVTLVDLEGFSYNTVSQILEIPIGTVMSRLCRGRQSLRTILEEIKPNSAQVHPIRLRSVK